MKSWFVYILLVVGLAGSLIFLKPRAQRSAGKMAPQKSTESVPKPLSSDSYLKQVYQNTIENKPINVSALEARIENELKYFQQEGAQRGHAPVLYQLLAVYSELAEMSGNVEQKKKVDALIGSLNRVAKERSAVHSEENSDKFIGIVKDHLSLRKNANASVAHWSTYSKLYPIMGNTNAAAKIWNHYIDTLMAMGKSEEAIKVVQAWVSDGRTEPTYNLEAIMKALSVNMDRMSLEGLTSFLQRADIQNLTDTRVQYVLAVKSFKENKFQSCADLTSPIIEGKNPTNAKIFYLFKDLLLRCYVEGNLTDKIQPLFAKHPAELSARAQPYKNKSDLAFEIVLGQRESAFATCSKVLGDIPEGKYYLILKQLLTCQLLYKEGLQWPEKTQNLINENLINFEGVAKLSKKAELFFLLFNDLRSGNDRRREVLTSEISQVVQKADPMRLALDKFYPKAN